MIQTPLLVIFLAAVACSWAGNGPASQIYTGLDLHNHSICSDGNDTPEVLMQKASAAGIKYFAITDHDTMACLDRAASAARAAGTALISGIEVSAEDDTIHILGLGINPNQPALRELVRRQLTERVARLRKIVEKLNAQGLGISIRDVLLGRVNHDRRIEGRAPLGYDDSEKTSERVLLKELEEEGRSITRPDIARTLLDKGYVKNSQQAFDIYLGEGKSAYVPMSGPGFASVIQIIHEAGGVASLAHPYTIFKYLKFPKSYSGKNYSSFDEAAYDFLVSGLDGFEQYKPRYGPDERVLRIAQAYERASGRAVLLTVGSDYHGGVGPDGSEKELTPIEIPGKVAEILLRRLVPK